MTKRENLLPGSQPERLSSNTNKAKIKLGDKPLKVQRLRNNEYYGTQEVFDNLYKRSEEGCKFKRLMPLITSEENIMLAFRNIKSNKGSNTPGTNNHKINYWAKAEQKEFIRYMRDRFTNYIPMPVKRKEIPKPNGKMRPLGIPTIEDRLLQQCIKQILEPICEAKFHENSYGFRPHRSTEHAIAFCAHRINIVKCRYIVDIDIKGFFDNVNHGKLLKQMWTLGIRDKQLLCIISKILKAPIYDNGILIDSTKGTPQGGILSPLLANIVLNELDWWIHSQWVGFQIKTPIKIRYNKSGSINRKQQFTILRKDSKLKEMYIVRYADDFKIFCQNREDATKIFNAVKMWLKERLQLDISPEKSGITDIYKHSTEFLGFEFKAFKKRNKMIMQSHMCKKAKVKVRENLSKAIDDMGNHPCLTTVGKYNATILGVQNYYQIATMINIDLARVAYSLSKKLKVRIRSIESKTGNVNKVYKMRYKNNYKKHFVCGTILFPLADIQTKPPMFCRGDCEYTKEGREAMHGKVAYINPQIIKYLVTNPPDGGSTLLYDNRLSLYAGQQGNCRITKKTLTIGDMELHHIIPKSMGGDDRYKNLIWVTSQVHKLIHGVNLPQNPKTINVLNEILEDDNKLKALNKYRKLAGNSEIMRQISPETVMRQPVLYSPVTYDKYILHDDGSYDVK